MTSTNDSNGQVRLAGAPDSWGVWFPDDPKQPHWSRFLDEVKQAGYNATELGPWGYLPTDPDALAPELQSRGLELAGVTVIQPLESESNWPAIEAEVRDAATLGKRFGVDNLVLIESMFSWEGMGEQRSVPRLDDEGWATMIATIIRVGEWLKSDWGMQVAFHPHADSYVETEAEIERLLDATPADVVKLCLDTGHHAYGGGDPVAFYKRHADRVSHIHLKDVDPAVLERARKERMDFGEAVAADVMVEPGRGTINYDELRQAFRDAGYGGWAVVEQDMYPAPLDKPLPIAVRTVRHLTGAGFQR